MRARARLVVVLSVSGNLLSRMTGHARMLDLPSLISSQLVCVWCMALIFFFFYFWVGAPDGRMEHVGTELVGEVLVVFCCAE